MRQLTKYERMGYINREKYTKLLDKQEEEINRLKKLVDALSKENYEFKENEKLSSIGLFVKGLGLCSKNKDKKIMEIE